MHEARLTREEGSILDYRVCTCKIGKDHDRIGRKNIPGRNPNAADA